jgi:TPR repeat protein
MPGWVTNRLRSQQSHAGHAGMNGATDPAEWRGSIQLHQYFAIYLQGDNTLKTSWKRRAGAGGGNPDEILSNLVRKMSSSYNEDFEEAYMPDTTAQDMDFNSGMAAFEAKHFSRAMQLLSPLAEQGNAEAQHRLAIMYQNGLGVAQHDELALRWMKASAENGYPVAQHGLGFMYLEGECAEKDPALAVQWFQKAADQGLVGSLTTLAMMYEEGNGVAQDSEKANELYRAAGFER